MTGARGAGALTALQELGLSDAFDSIYGTSAGFANACFFLAGDMHIGSSIYYEELCSKEFINLKRVWDIVDVDYVLDILKENKKLSYKKISTHHTDLYARLFNLVTKSTEYKKVNGLKAEEIERVMHAAISLPYLDPGSVDIQNIKYMDADAAKKKQEFKAIKEEMENSDATDILVIYNYYDQFEYMRDAGLTDSDRIYQIVPYAEEKLSRVSNDPNKLRKASREMKEMVLSIFGQETPILL
jgi:predicted patatin/cPLA2 family phospholipase